MVHGTLPIEELKRALPERFLPLFGEDFRIDLAVLHHLLDQETSQRDKDIRSLIQAIGRVNRQSFPPCNAHGLLPPNGFFAIHTLNLIAETRQAAFLEDLLPLLRSGQSQLQALLGNFLRESLWEMLYHLAKDDWALLTKLLREKGISDAVREAILVCICQVAWHQPIHRPKVFSWFRDLLRELNQGELEFSQPLLGVLIRELGDLRAAPLLAEMEELSRKTEWPLGLTGTFLQWKSSMEDPLHAWARRPIYKLDSRYRFYISTLFPSSPENLEDAVRIDLPSPGKPMRSNARSFSRPSTPIKKAPKAGRNAPCPCGSGKKYKKCHGK